MKDSAVTKPNDNQCGEGLRESIAEAAGEFARNQPGIHPGSIFVDHHGASLTITLKKVLAGSEKYAIRDKRAAALIARTLSEAFRAEAACKLFAALRRLDNSHLDIIVATTFPNHGLGRAINDRLSRASR
jgi:hypothetical protein